MIYVSTSDERAAAAAQRDRLLAARRAIGEVARQGHTSAERSAAFRALQAEGQRLRAFPVHVVEELDAAGRALRFAEDTAHVNPAGAERLRRWAWTETGAP